MSVKDGKRMRIGLPELVPMVVFLGWLAFRWIGANGWKNDFFEDIGYAGLGLTLICFRNRFGQTEGYAWGGTLPVRIKRSPPIIVASLGWFLVIGMPVILFLI